MKYKFTSVLQKLTAALLVLCILAADVAGILPADFAGVFVAKGEAAYTYGDLSYIIMDDEVTITDCNESAVTIEIPADIDGLPVTRIDYRVFSYCRSLISITIPNSVTSIGEMAFFYCESLISITIPTSVTSIGVGVFRECTSLTSITIPNSVKSIGDEVFVNCNNLTSIVIPSKVTSIGNSAFAYCTNLKSITIPNSVTSIGDGAFYYCTSLGSITIPNGVTSISPSTFGYCTSLTSIIIPDNVSGIGGWAFEYCESLTSITIPDSVTSIGEATFAHCLTLTNVIIPDNVTIIGSEAFFNCVSLTEIIIPNSVTSVGSGAFLNCSGLKKISISKSVTSISHYMLQYSINLTSVIIPNSVMSIGIGAFYNCENLESIIIPDSVTYINVWAFYNCKDLTIYCNPNSYAESYAISNGIPYKYIIDYNSETATKIILSVSDLRLNITSGGEPVAGADVVISFPDEPLHDTIGLTSGADGIVSTSYSYSGKMSIEVTASGYHTYEETITFPTFRTVEINLVDANASYLKTATYNDNGFLTETAYINRAITDESARLEFEYICKETISEYQLVQSSKVLAKSTDGSFSLKKDVFTYGSDVYLHVKAGGKTYKERLNLKINDFTYLGGYEFKLGSGIELKVPDNSPILAGATFEVDSDALKTPVMFEVTDDKVKIGFKVDPKNIKDTKLINSEIDKIMKDFFSNDVKKPFKVSIALAGYIELKASEKNRISVVSSCVQVQVKVGGTAGFSVPIPVISIPLRVEFDYEGSGKLTIKNISVETEPFAIKFNNTDLDFKVEFLLRVGLGYKYLSAGVYGQLESEVKTQIIPEFDFKEWTIEGEAGVYGRIGFLEGRAPIWKGGKYYLYPDYKNVKSMSLLSESDIAAYLADTSNYSFIDRFAYSAYNSAISAYAADPDTIRANAYTYIEPQIVTCGDTTVMAYIDNNIERDDYNFPTLVYQVYENGAWSEPKQVDSNNTADSEFDLYTDGKNIYIAYTEANRQLTSEDSIDTIPSVLDISVTRFDVNSNTFSNFYSLTSDDVYDYSPVMTSVGSNAAVLWVNNTDNDIFGMTSNNAVYLAVEDGSEWTVKSVTTGLNSIVSLDVGALDGNPSAVVINDEDNDMTTVNDRSVNVIDLTSNLICAIEDEENIESENANCLFFEDSLYWYSGGKISKVSALDSEVAYIAEESNIGGDFRIVKLHDDRNAIVYKTPTDNGVSLSAIIQNGTEWNEAVSLVETENSIDGYEIAALDGKLYAIYVETTPTFGDESFTTYSDLKFVEILSAAKPEISVVDFSEYDVIAGNELAVNFTIKNAGLSDMTEFNVKVTDNSNNALAEETYTGTLKSGESGEYSISFTVPQYEDGKTFKLEIESNEITTEYELDLNVCDFSVEGKSIITGGKNLISVSVVNDGYVTAGGTLYGYNGDTDGELFFTQTVDPLASGGCVNYQFDVNELVLSEGIANSITFVFVADVDELNDYNNSDVVNMLNPISEPGPLYGDVNGDDEINAADVTAIKRWLAGWEVTINEVSADVNGDEKVNDIDVVILKRYCADWVITLGKSA